MTRPPPAGWAIALAATALALNLFLWGLAHRGPAPRGLVGDEVGYLARASLRAAGEPVAPQALWPSGYEGFVAATLKVAAAAHVEPPWLGTQLAQVLLWGFLGVALWGLAGELLPSAPVRLLALALFMLNPTLAAFSHYLWPEVPYLAAVLGALWILVRQPVGAGWDLALGGLMAAAAGLKLVYLPVTWLALAVLPLVRLRQGRRPWVALAAPAVFLALHGPGMPADSRVFNAWVGLGDVARSDWGPEARVGEQLEDYLRSAPTPAERDQIYIGKIRARIARRGLGATLGDQLGKQYYRLLDHRTFFTKQLPGGVNPRYPFEDPTLARALRWANDAIWGATLLGFGLGAVLLLRPPFGWLQGLLGLIGYNLALFSILHVKTRYVLAFLPFLCLISALGWGALRDALAPQRPALVPGRPLTAATRAAGLLLSALLLHLAFSDLLP